MILQISKRTSKKQKLRRTTILEEEINGKTKESESKQVKSIP